MTSQHNTGTHPFYIGMYIHIYTHICILLRRNVYVFFTKTPPWLFVLLTIHPKLSCSNGMHLERKGTVPRGKFNQKIPPNASATRRRSAVLLVPCKYIQHIQRDLGCVMEQAKHLVIFLMYLYQRQQSLIYENRNTACIHVQQRPNVRNIQNARNRVFEKKLRYNPSGWVWFVFSHPQNGGFPGNIPSLSIRTITKLSNM